MGVRGRNSEMLSLMVGQHCFGRWRDSDGSRQNDGSGHDDNEVSKQIDGSGQDDDKVSDGSGQIEFKITNKEMFVTFLEYTIKFKPW